MTFWKIQSKHEDMIHAVGKKIHRSLLVRASQLVDKIRKVYPQLQSAQTGMGRGYFRGDNIPVIWEDGEKNELEISALYEWAECLNNRSRKVYNPAGITPIMQRNIMELVEILNFVAETNTIPDLEINRP